MNQIQSIAITCLLFTAVEFLGAGAAFGQSDVVFMTTYHGVQSKLHRFNNGTDQYAVDTGQSNGFTGVTIVNNEVLVGDLRTDSVHRFSFDGEFLGEFVYAPAPANVESDSHGFVYVRGLKSGPIFYRLDSLGEHRKTFFVLDTFSLAGIDADAAGNVFVADYDNLSLVKFSSNGTQLSSTPINLNVEPGDISIDEAG